MSNFLKATQQKLRFQTPRGVLGTEQLWDLSLEELDQVAVQLDEGYKNSKGKSFLNKKTKKDKTIKLKLDIVLQIISIIQEEQEALQTAAETKSHNQKILGLIAEKQNAELAGKSVEELTEMLK